MHDIINQDVDLILQSDLPWEMLKDKSILITGANGMLPAYFIYVFMALNKKYDMNIKIYALVRNRAKAYQKFNELIDNANNFRLIIQDVSFPLSIDDDINIVIHAASQASPKYYGIDPVGTINANVLGTNNLLKLCQTKNVENFLFVSTGEVYGIPLKPVDITENDYGYIDILNVRSCYAESKRLAETMCIAWHHQYGIPTKIARVHHSYGPGMLLDDGRVFADFVNDIIHNNDIILNSDGSAKRPFCYISDCISAMLTVLMKGKNGNAYNIANIEEYLSIRSLAELMVELFPEKNLHVVLKYPSNDNHYIKSPISEACPNVNKILSLGWAPKVSAKEGFLRTIRSF